MEGLERLMFKNSFAGKHVLVTGNTGFKGSWLTVWLLKLGARVVGVSKDIPTVPSMFEELRLREEIDHHELDIRDLSRLAELVMKKQPDVVFHLAAQPIVSRSFQDPIETLSSNVMGTAHVLEALRRSGHPSTVVIITSDKCYDNVEWVWGYRETDRLGGKDIYSGSKGAAELVFRSYLDTFFRNGNVRLATARAGNVIGGGDWAVDRIVPDCMRAWSQGQPVTIRSPLATRPWQHVLEPLSGYLALAQGLMEHPKGLHGESFNFGPNSDQNHTVQRIIEDLSSHWDFARPEDAYRVTGQTAFPESALLKLNCDKALHLLKWLPTLVYPRMIGMVGSWYRAYYRQGEPMHDLTLGQIAAYEAEGARKGLPWAE
jgi:CDP-glucose 4,6-dehydratase